MTSPCSYPTETENNKIIALCNWIFFFYTALINRTVELYGSGNLQWKNVAWNGLNIEWKIHRMLSEKNAEYAHCEIPLQILRTGKSNLFYYKSE